MKFEVTHHKPPFGPEKVEVKLPRETKRKALWVAYYVVVAASVTSLVADQLKKRKLEESHPID